MLYSLHLFQDEEEKKQGSYFSKHNPPSPPDFLTASVLVFYLAACSASKSQKALT